MKAVIRSIGSYLPEKVMSNQEFAEFLDTSDEWIVSHTGIRYRHIASDEQAASDLGLEASKTALSRANFSPKELDLILVATATADYKGFPSTACIIQDKLGADNAGAMDITAACTGFIYGLEIAKNFIITGTAKNILVIGTEVLTRIANWKDRNTCVLFGDGAGAVLVSLANSKESEERGILNSILRAEGSGAHVLKVPVGGSRTPYKADGTGDNNIFLTMDGQPVYKFAVRVITQVIKDLLDKNNLTIDDIAYIVPHQANIRIIEAAAKRLKIPKEKFYTNMDRVANTSAASIPIALNEIYEAKKIKNGDLIITVGFGGGLTYGGNLIRW